MRRSYSMIEIGGPEGRRLRKMRRARRARIVLWGVLLPLLAGATLAWDTDDAPQARPHPGRALEEVLSSLEGRVGALEGDVEGLEGFHAEEVAPVVHALLRLSDDTAHVRRIARAIVREGRRTGIPRQLLVAVIAVENPWLDLGARSPMGAVGLMQVMPFHAGAWGCGGADLTDIDVNICHGTRILRQALRRTQGDLDRALLAYNGCVRGVNTPDCHLYPSWVFRYTGSDWRHTWDPTPWMDLERTAAAADE